jgi:hypothetical protein
MPWDDNASGSLRDSIFVQGSQDLAQSAAATASEVQVAITATVDDIQTTWDGLDLTGRREAEIQEFARRHNEKLVAVGKQPIALAPAPDKWQPLAGALLESQRDVGVFLVDAATFGKIEALHSEANRLVAENGGL